jgi:hypothetical protein
VLNTPTIQRLYKKYRAIRSEVQVATPVPKKSVSSVQTGQPSIMENFNGDKFAEQIIGIATLGMGRGPSGARITVKGATTRARIQVTEKGLARVESHLSQFGDDVANTIMLQRLRSGQRTQQDLNFYTHELKEVCIYAARAWCESGA